MVAVVGNLTMLSRVGVQPFMRLRRNSRRPREFAQSARGKDDEQRRSRRSRDADHTNAATYDQVQSGSPDALLRRGPLSLDPPMNSVRVGVPEIEDAL